MSHKPYGADIVACLDCTDARSPARNHIPMKERWSERGIMHKVFSVVLRRVRQLPAYVAHANEFLKGRSPPSAAARPAKKHKSKKEVDELAFEKWQVRNPGGTFKEYYVSAVLPALAGKKAHATLGPATVDGSLERAKGTARALIGLGISKSDLVVDFGCGTLRHGRTLIEYLEPARYVGLDIDRRILDSGLAILPPGLAERKTPILDVIGDDVLDRIASMRPRWVFAKGVLHHVPPADLEEFFGNVSRLACPETIVLIWTRFSDTGAAEQTSKRTWSHSLEGVLSAARTFRLDSEMTEVDGMRVVRFRLSQPL
jgi:SAM-dependent methyltransferase